MEQVFDIKITLSPLEMAAIKEPYTKAPGVSERCDTRCIIYQRLWQLLLNQIAGQQLDFCSYCKTKPVAQKCFGLCESCHAMAESIAAKVRQKV